MDFTPEGQLTKGLKKVIQASNRWRCAQREKDFKLVFIPAARWTWARIVFIKDIIVIRLRTPHRASNGTKWYPITSYSSRSLRSLEVQSIRNSLVSKTHHSTHRQFQVHKLIVKWITKRFRYFFFITIITGIVNYSLRRFLETLGQFDPAVRSQRDSFEKKISHALQKFFEVYSSRESEKISIQLFKKMIENLDFWESQQITKENRIFQNWLSTQKENIAVLGNIFLGLNDPVCRRSVSSSKSQVSLAKKKTSDWFFEFSAKSFVPFIINSR